MVAERLLTTESPVRPRTDAANDNRGRWIAVAVLCLGQLMLTLDATAANVALPSIQHDLHFTQSSLAWVVNGYLITFGGLLLLAGRLGDLIGRRRVFLSGLAIFTLASMLCGLASSQPLLIGARCLQGVAAACDASMILGILFTIFADQRDTARAVGIYTFIAVTGGSIGLLAGGALTQVLSWHWIFFINLPIGAAALVLGSRLIPDHKGIGLQHGVDLLGALLVTATPALAVYTFIQASDSGWGSGRTFGLAAATIVLALAFVAVEARISNPLIPLRVFRLRNVVGANVVRALMVFGMYGWFFLGALYLQHVLRFGVLETGLAFVPQPAIVAVFSLFITRRVVARWGNQATVIAGVALSACGTLLFARASVDGSYVAEVLPALLLTSSGAGLAFMPSVSLAMAGADPGDSGLVSGLANVSVQMGAAVGIAVLASLATTHTNNLLAQGYAVNAALTSGYDLGFIVAGACAAVAVVVAAVVLRSPARKMSVVEGGAAHATASVSLQE